VLRRAHPLATPAVVDRSGHSTPHPSVVA
jgi:hypothetical protein